MKLAAAADDPGERVRTLKQVGDTSLYVAGFFAESLTRSLVDVDYYVGLGQTAYAQLARSLRPRQVDHRGLRGARRQVPAVRRRARARSASAADFATSDVGRLYEIWLRTRDEWIEKKLRAVGVLVDPARKVIQ